MNLKKNFIRFFLILFILFTSTQKSFSIEPKQFIQSIVDEASKILVKDLSKEVKINKLISIAEKTVDIRGIGLYTLGSHRKNLTDSQKIMVKNMIKDIKDYKFLIEIYGAEVFSRNAYQIRKKAQIKIWDRLLKEINIEI